MIRFTSLLILGEFKQIHYEKTGRDESKWTQEILKTEVMLFN